jgi:hypothetical protein
MKQQFKHTLHYQRLADAQTEERSSRIKVADKSFFVSFSGIVEGLTWYEALLKG